MNEPHRWSLSSSQNTKSERVLLLLFLCPCQDPNPQFHQSCNKWLYSTSRDDLLNWRFAKDNSEELRTADDSISEESNRSLWARCQLSSWVGPRTQWHWSAERPAKTREFLWWGRAPSREQPVTSKAAAFVRTQSLVSKHECIFVVGSWKALLVI